MRRIALFLVIVMLLSAFIAGCGQQKAVEEKPEEALPEQGTVETVDEELEIEPLSPKVKVTVSSSAWPKVIMRSWGLKSSQWLSIPAKI